MKSFIALLPLVALALAQDNAVQIPLSPDTILTPAEPQSESLIPLLGFGTWNLDRANATEAVSWAIQTGYRHIDCAAAYRNQDLVGKGIADGLKKTGLKRSDLWITSKLWNDHHGKKHVEDGIDVALKDLDIDYLDLYLMHWPVASGKFGNKIEYKKTWDAMTKLVKKSKTRHVGVSNFDPEQLEDLLASTSHPPSVHQMELHPYLQQNEWIKYHASHGIHVTAYSPFAGTNPTYSKGEPPQLLNNTVVTGIAKKRKCTATQVALQWAWSRGTSAIPKSSHESRISENYGALECKIEHEDLEKLNALGDYHHRFNNPTKSWGVPLYQGLEDSKGKHKEHS